MMDPDKTAKVQTIPRCKPRDPWEETASSLQRARACAPASSIRESIERLLAEMACKQENAA